MKFNRRQYKADAKQVLKSCFWTALVACIIVSALSGALTSFTTFRNVFSGGSLLPSISQPAITDGIQNADPGEITIPDDLTDPNADPAELYQYGLVTSDETAAPVPAVTTVSSGVSAPIALLFTILVANVIEVGCAYFFIRCREGEAEIGNVFQGFKVNYGGNIGVMFIRTIFITLWSLLLVIPGIIKWYQYSMVPYILSENSGMTYKEAFKLSTDMTRGHKWDLFMLDLSFIGWYLLCIATAGLGFIFLMPYTEAAKAEAYAALKAALDEPKADVAELPAEEAPAEA